MNKDTKTRLERAKSYVKTHTPQVATAAATVAAFLLLREQAKSTRQIARNTEYTARRLEADFKGRVHSAAVMKDCVEQSRTFDYLPGVGVYVHPKKTKIES